ncbi:hypothetical protein U27_04979 [Candidatus Vecturithrix granuli]|uniref:Zinc-ribbon domain-containing protein n=1 Tax=Vecturithrix granuli TaxID=1499967 RepID=A0A081C0A1_VECG1|nr:hypothetical protein U27_04979 [Candidatus Vecturithrix granuli]
MKEDFSKDNKVRKHKDQKAPEEFDLASYQPFSKDEEDEDFEILDALEHMEHAESLEEDYAAEGDRMIELALDDDDTILGDENMDEEESGFHFDEQMSAGLEQELLDQGHDFDFDKSFEEDMGEAELGEGSFVLDLNQEDGEQPSDLSFDTETELEEEEQGVAAEFGSSFDFDEDTEETSSSKMGLLDFGLEGQDEYSGDLEEQEEPFEPEDFSEGESPDKQKTIEDIAGGIEIAEGFADLESDISIEDEDLLEQELPEMDFARESDEFAGKAVIAVGNDRVIDLGNEEDFEQEEEFDFSSDSWQQEDMETPEIMGMAPEAEEKEPLEIEFESELAEQDQEEEFMTSFDDIDLDLEAEATKVLEESESFGQFDLTEELPENEIEPDVDIDLDVEGDMDAEAFGSMPFVEDAAEPSIASAPSEETVEDEFFEEQFEEEFEEQEEEIPPISETPPAAPDVKDNAEELVESERDEREFLDLSLRLSGPQMEEFEDMIREAKTLQSYLDGLETHQTEIKKKIYQKLRDEYISRRKDIFRAPEFTTLLTDVNQDLQDMLAKQAGFISTVERLNEELEEITVRHLVGEYDQATLDEKQASQNAEIALWNGKNEKIKHVITRYQQILEAEHTLNPLRTEQEEEQAKPEPLSEPQEETTFADWTNTQDREETEADFAEPSTFPTSEEESLIETGLAEEESLSEEMPELQETEEEYFESSFEDDFDLDVLSKVAEQLVEETSEEEEQEELEEETPQVEMISCKKCGRQTPASEKFCTHCGAKAR